MKKWFTIFCYIVIAAIILAGLVDLIFVLVGGSGETLSYEFWIVSKKYPAIPFALGFLCGHLVWQYDPDSIKPS